ncbi:MAG TPA: THUMP domain-containing protein [Bacteriovoracaceae bacterium]|nr:THUMP domain-containing protein [Bacteriovoracaceae bacterium]
MNKFRFEYFASCPVGLEELLAQEIKDLGAKNTTINRGGVAFEAFHEIALRVILYTRIASRVYKYLYQFEVRNEKEYYLEATDVKWKSLMTVQQTFRLNTIFGDLPREREEFRNSQFSNLKLKDAIVDYFRHYVGERPSIDKENPDVVFLARIETGKELPYSITLMLDLCGAPLSQRGYRISKTEAPLKENVAAGLLKLVNWDPTKEGLLDAMTGSGTIAIEAALMAANIPPSFLRVERALKQPNYKVWNFQQYPWLLKDEFLMENYKNLLAQVHEDTEKGLQNLGKIKNKIVANEKSEMVFYSAKENIRKARLEGIINLTLGDALETTPNSEKTLFICNPPYGERLQPNEEDQLKALYKGLGDHWKQQFKGHRAALLTGNLEMLKSVGLKTSKRLIIHNGDIECRLAQYDLY